MHHIYVVRIYKSYLRNVIKFDHIRQTKEDGKSWFEGLSGKSEDVLSRDNVRDNPDVSF